MRPSATPSAARILTLLAALGWWGVAAALALTLCLAAASPFLVRWAAADTGPSGVTLGVPISFSIDAAGLRAAAPSLAVEGAAIDDAHGVLRLPETRAGVIAPVLLALAVMLAAVLWVLGQLRALFRTLAEGRPFVAENAVRLRRVAYVLIAGELVRALAVLVGTARLLPSDAGDAIHVSTLPDLNIYALLQAVIILAVAEVFRAGTRLDEDQSLTI